MAVMFGLWSGPAMACPNPDLNAATTVQTNGATLRLGLNRRTTAGGTATLAACPHVTADVPGDVAMMFNAVPALSADVGGMMGMAMEISADANCATALLVRTASGDWYYDDRGRGIGMPRIMMRSPGAGQLQVWIGTTDGSVCRARVNMMTYAG